MSSLSLPVVRQELTVIKRPSRESLDQPVVKVLCRLEPCGALVDLCWRRSIQRKFPSILNKVHTGSLVYATGTFAATIYKQSDALLVLKSIDAFKIDAPRSREFQYGDGCYVPVIDESERRLWYSYKIMYEKKVELAKITERLEKMNISVEDTE
jgi:hypothetical protein